MLCSICAGRPGGRRNRLLQSGAGCAPSVCGRLESLIELLCLQFPFNATCPGSSLRAQKCCIKHLLKIRSGLCAMLGGRPTGCIEQKLSPEEVQTLLEKIVVPAELHDALRKSLRDIFDRVSCPADVSAGAKRVQLSAPMTLLEKHHAVAAPAPGGSVSFSPSSPADVPEPHACFDVQT